MYLTEIEYRSILEPFSFSRPLHPGRSIDHILERRIMMRNFFKDSVVVPRWIHCGLLCMFWLHGLGDCCRVFNKQIDAWQTARLAAAQDQKQRDFRAFETEFRSNVGQYGCALQGDIIPSLGFSVYAAGTEGDGLLILNKRHIQDHTTAAKFLSPGPTMHYGRLDLPDRKDYLLAKVDNGVVYFKHIVPRHHWEN